MKNPDSSIKQNVSVISANYNNGRYLGDFLHSLEESSVLPDEVIVVDDHSSDSSLEFLKNYAGNLNLICVLSKEHIGFSEALNLAVKKAKGYYLLRLDPDDMIHPLRIEKQLNYLQANPAFDLIGSNVKYFQDSPVRSIFHSNVPFDNPAIRKSVLKGNIPVIHSSMLGKREIFTQNPYKTFNYPVEDYHFLAQLVKNNLNVGNIREYLTYVRIHKTSASSNILIDTTKTIFHIRQELFGIKSNSFLIWKNFYQIKFYRKFLIGKYPFRWFFLLISGILDLRRVFKRITR